MLLSSARTSRLLAFRKVATKTHDGVQHGALRRFPKPLLADASLQLLADHLSGAFAPKASWAGAVRLRGTAAAVGLELSALKRARVWGASSCANRRSAIEKGCFSADRPVGSF